MDTANGQNEYDCALKCGDIQDGTELTEQLNLHPENQRLSQLKQIHHSLSMIFQMETL